MYVVPWIKLIPQSTQMGCWYASAQMLIQWKRERLQMTLPNNADPSELTMTVAWEVDNRGITNPQVIRLAKALGLATVEAMTPTVKRLTYLLQYYGPLWTNGREHIVVIGGIDENKRLFLVYDPSPVDKGSIEWRPYSWYINSSKSVPDSRDVSTRCTSHISISSLDWDGVTMIKIRALPLIGSVACLLVTSQCGESKTTDKTPNADIRNTNAIDVARGKSTDESRVEPQPIVSDKAQKRSLSDMNAIDIVPGKSIGKLTLGAPASEIVKQATITAHVGELDGIKYAIQNGKIDDVWIDDLREFKGEIRFRGRAISNEVPLEELKNIFGGCEKVEGVKGGNFFNCPVGITIGCDFNGRGDFIQIRLKPR